MKTSTQNQSGVAHLMAIGLVVLVAVVGFAGYKVMQANKSTTTDNSVSRGVSLQTSATVPDTLSNAAELKTLSTVASSLPLDSDLNPATMDSDINQLQ